MARPARAVTATILSCGNGAESSAVPAEPNIARFSGVSRKTGHRATSPSRPATVVLSLSTKV